VRFADHTKDPDPAKQMLQRAQFVKQQAKPALLKRLTLLHPAPD
jgi:hypothetical protein